MWFRSTFRNRSLDQRPTYPTSKTILPGRSTWMLKSMASEPPVTYLGSRRKSVLSKTLLALAGWIPLGEFCSGMISPPLTVGSGGTLMWLPSTPIRKLVFGLPPVLQPVGTTRPVLGSIAPLPGAVQTERSPNPIPSAGVRTSPTPFLRSNARDQPPRSTVFLFPNTLPSGPSVKLGFQETAKRGPKFV